MPLCEAAAVLKRVADALSIDDPAQLPAKWDSLVAHAHKRAAGDICSAVGLKSYSAAQVAASDQFSAWHEDLSYVYAMCQGVGLSDYRLDAVKMLNPLPMLKEPVGLTFAGVPLPPDGSSQVGGIGSGTLAAYEAERCASAKWFR